MKKNLKMIVIIFLSVLLCTIPVTAANKPISPTVQKQVTNKTTRIKVQANKKTILYVEVNNKLLSKVKYKKDQIKIISIPKQKAGMKIKFYTKDKAGKRSKTVTRKVKDVIAPKKTVVRFTADQKLQIKGEKGCFVSIVEDAIMNPSYDPIKVKDEESIVGKIKSKRGFIYDNRSFGIGSRYIIKLRDSAGNWSKPTILDFNGYGDYKIY
ncbi:hypothetical protein [uncultured Robinsoniella sp.]|uniref:hypothetical protein n=1 Tax=uncultured Robinsoniella sp. TaxID=904190 RepID=UPI00374E4071